MIWIVTQPSVVVEDQLVEHSVIFGLETTRVGQTSGVGCPDAASSVRVGQVVHEGNHQHVPVFVVVAVEKLANPLRVFGDGSEVGLNSIVDIPHHTVDRSSVGCVGGLRVQECPCFGPGAECCRHHVGNIWIVLADAVPEGEDITQSVGSVSDNIEQLFAFSQGQIRYQDDLPTCIVDFAKFFGNVISLETVVPSEKGVGQIQGVLQSSLHWVGKSGAIDLLDWASRRSGSL